jgi:hypothetical protein
MVKHFVTHQKFTEQKYVNNESKRIVAIGNDVWIGYGSNNTTGDHHWRCVLF